METTLVTGGAGFIGSNVIPLLLSEGYRVICLDNFDDTYNPEFKRKNIAPFLTNKNFKLEELDIRDMDKTRAIFEREKPTYVIHLAAMADTRNAVKEPFVYISVNINGTLNILELSRDFSVKNLVIASSSSVYGNDSEVPWKEDVRADKALSPYGATKRAIEVFAHTYYHNFGLNITCLRYFNAYGENNRPNMVPYIWAEQILTGGEVKISGDGSRKRDYTYVGDVAKATVLAVKKPLGFEIINIGNNKPISLRELLSIFEKVTGLKPNVKSYESHQASVEVTYASVDKAKKFLGWEPSVNIEEGIKKLISWFNDNRLKNLV